MSYNTKKVISNILLFLETIFLFSIVLLFVTKLTFNKKTIIKKMNKTDYYETVYNNIYDNMRYITKKSGFSKIVLEDIYVLEDVKRDVNKYIENIFENDQIYVDISSLKENIETNLDKFIEENQQEVTEEKKSEYISKIVYTYKNEIRLMKEYNDSAKDINNISRITTVLLILFIVDLIVLIIINKVIFKKLEFYVLCFSSASALLVTNLLVKLLSNNLFIYNNALTKVFKLVIDKGLIINLIITVVLIVLGIVSKKLIIEEKEEIYE